MTSQTHGLNNSCPKIYKPAAGGWPEAWQLKEDGVYSHDNTANLTAKLCSLSPFSSQITIIHLHLDFPILLPKTSMVESAWDGSFPSTFPPLYHDTWMTLEKEIWTWMIFFIYCCDVWGVHCAFIKVLTMYQMYHLNSPPPPFLTWTFFSFIF
jgi:hypothetical protein